MKALDLVGTFFGEYEVISKNPERLNGKVMWNCKCSCGRDIKVSTSNLRTGHSDKCKVCSKTGSNSNRYKHGEAKTPLYNTWKAMRQRCYNVHNKDYKYYGAKGVTVCEEWFNFVIFKDWAVNNGYEDGLSIDKDRLCDKLNIYPKLYSPITCEWVTVEENASYRKL